MFARSDYKGTNCLGCHQAQEGDVLGVVKISYSLADIEQEVSKKHVNEHAAINGDFHYCIYTAGGDV